MAIFGQGQSQIDYRLLAKGLIAPVQNAGRVIMEIYQNASSREINADGSPSTKADHDAETILPP